MNFIEKLNSDLDQQHLLKHPFYQTWNKGELTAETLALYAKEYYHHVAAFPRYISAIHSQCDNLAYRQILLSNLNEEEQGENNHPELWIRFAEGLGCTREEIQATAELASTHKLVNGYFDLTRESFAKGLGALYAYERQTPDVSISKIEGLTRFYGITKEDVLAFFNVHAEADVWHSNECASLIEKLDADQQKEVYEGATTGAKLLWKFLDGIEETITIA